MLLLYGTKPGDSSTELEEAEMNNDDTENERGPLNTIMEESRPFYIEAVVEDAHHLQAIYVILRSGRNVKEKWTYPQKNVLVCA